MENRRVWDWKNGGTFTQDDLITTIHVVERDINTLSSAIKNCNRTQIADYVIDIESAKARLTRMESELIYLKALSHEAV